MKNIILISTSPKKDGNCASILEELRTSLKARALFLSDYDINPCIDCSICKKQHNTCALDIQENYATKKLFDELLEADEIVFISPIYFYHLPSKFKAFVDRSQRFWKENQTLINKKMHVVFVAARQKGDKLPEGSLLTLKYFAPTIQAELASSICLYGLESKNDFLQSSSSQEKLHNYIEETFDGIA